MSPVEALVSAAAVSPVDAELSVLVDVEEELPHPARAVAAKTADRPSAAMRFMFFRPLSSLSLFLLFLKICKSSVMGAIAVFCGRPCLFVATECPRRVYSVVVEKSGLCPFVSCDVKEHSPLWPRKITI